MTGRWQRNLRISPQEKSSTNSSSQKENTIGQLEVEKTKEGGERVLREKKADYSIPGKEHKSYEGVKVYLRVRNQSRKGPSEKKNGPSREAPDRMRKKGFKKCESGRITILNDTVTVPQTRYITEGES